MKGKLIIIEGTDCSGKETQCKKLIEKLNGEGYKTFTMPFPRYDTPTGAIIGGPLLGKSHICESFFGDPVSVPPKVAGLYYVADRLYNSSEIVKNLEEGKIVILDRYTTSNMGHQGGKLSTKEERKELYEFYDKLEFDMCGLPRPDGVIFLHMPAQNVFEIRTKRVEELDKVEQNDEYIKAAERAYLEMNDLFGFKYVPCAVEGKTRSIEDIGEDVYKLAKEIIDGK